MDFENYKKETFEDRVDLKKIIDLFAPIDQFNRIGKKSPLSLDDDEKKYLEEKSIIAESELASFGIGFEKVIHEDFERKNFVLLDENLFMKMLDVFVKKMNSNRDTHDVYNAFVEVIIMINQSLDDIKTSDEERFKLYYFLSRNLDQYREKIEKTFGGDIFAESYAYEKSLRIMEKNYERSLLFEGVLDDGYIDGYLKLRKNGLNYTQEDLNLIKSNINKKIQNLKDDFLKQERSGFIQRHFKRNILEKFINYLKLFIKIIEEVNSGKSIHFEDDDGVLIGGKYDEDRELLNYLKEKREELRYL